MAKAGSANIKSVEYTETTTFERSLNRVYLMIVMTSGSGTVSFGGGGGEIPLSENSFYEPSIVPTSEFTVTITSGSFVVVSAGG